MRNSTTSNKNPIPSGRLLEWGAGVFWLAVWLLAFLAVGEPLLLPSPWAVLCSMAKLSVTADFWLITAGSLLRIMSGFLLGLVAGGLLAVLTALFPLVRAAVALPMGIIKATPVASFVILALLFIKGQGFSVFIAFLMVLPLAWSNLSQGIANTDPRLLELGRVYHFSTAYRLRYIYLPSVFPYLLSAARVGLGFAWKAGIAGEVIAIPANAMGTQLYNAKVHLETADLFAWTAVIILLSLLLEKLTVGLLGRFTPATASQEKGGCRHAADS